MTIPLYFYELGVAVSWISGICGGYGLRGIIDRNKAP